MCDPKMFAKFGCQTFCNKKEEKTVSQALDRQTNNFNDILQAKVKSGKYLLEKCQSEQYLQLPFKYS